jgi:chemotaxis protein methyltransferase CheR
VAVSLGGEWCAITLRGVLMKRNDIENIEITLLLEAIFQRYGYDFRSYARASIERRVRHFLPKCGCATISELIPRLLHDESFFEPLVHEFSITVSEMFRDPTVYRRIREKVVPFLKTYPFVKIWHAGCASGEEVYSLAILLKEEGLYDRATIFATDFNDSALEQARQGIYALETVQQFTSNYQQAGGTRSFSEYYHAHYEAMAIDETLKRNITFANHNLATDGVFGEMHLILCRNVLIYFNKELQNRALKLFRDSLARGGFLCLGSKESLLFSDVQTDLKPIDEKARIYQKTTA